MKQKCIITLDLKYKTEDKKKKSEVLTQCPRSKKKKKKVQDRDLIHVLKETDSEYER